MGMSEMFSEKAELGGLLASGENVVVSDVIHKAFIEVDEEGTEVRIFVILNSYFG